MVSSSDVTSRVEGKGGVWGVSSFLLFYKAVGYLANVVSFLANFVGILPFLSEFWLIC